MGERITYGGILFDGARRILIKSARLLRVYRLSSPHKARLPAAFELACKALYGLNFEVLKDIVSLTVAVFVKFQNFKISAEFNLADLIAGAAVRVKLRRS